MVWDSSRYRIFFLRKTSTTSLSLYTLHIHCYPLLMQNIFRIRLLPFTSTTTHSPRVTIIMSDHVIHSDQNVQMSSHIIWVKVLTDLLHDFLLPLCPQYSLSLFLSPPLCSSHIASLLFGSTNHLNLRTFALTWVFFPREPHDLSPIFELLLKCWLLSEVILDHAI